MKKRIPALYVHIPFCRKVCPFCSFAVMKDSIALHAPYLDLLEKELQLLKETVLPSYVLGEVDSVYFGGGTPSLFSLAELNRILEMLQSYFGFTSTAQWSIEMNPEDVTSEKVKGLLNLGFNRISLGIQSFNDSHLLKLGRHHTVAQSRKAIELILENNFKEINLDLMYGFPGQTLEQLHQDLKAFCSYAPAHISPYCLNIEPRTVLNRRENWKNWQGEHEELLYQMFVDVSDYLKLQGYKHYEVSNFCQLGKPSRQNIYNWSGQNYLGIGAGAHSYLFPERFANQKRFIDYKADLNLGRLPRSFTEKLRLEEQLDEYIMIRLRLEEGIVFKDLEAQFRVKIKEQLFSFIEKLCCEKMAIFQNERLQLTTKGLFLADEIAAELAVLIL